MCSYHSIFIKFFSNRIESGVQCTMSAIVLSNLNKGWSSLNASLVIDRICFPFVQIFFKNGFCNPDLYIIEIKCMSQSMVSGQCCQTTTQNLIDYIGMINC